MIVADLVSAGHRLADIKGYSLDQIALFARAHTALSRRRLRDELIVARGAQAPEKGFAKLLDALSSRHP